ncbi:hypothetical protein ACFL27_24560, partial [candidate division CSSED10-310 bacterium]
MSSKKTKITGALSYVPGPRFFSFLGSIIVVGAGLAVAKVTVIPSLTIDLHHVQTVDLDFSELTFSSPLQYQIAIILSCLFLWLGGSYVLKRIFVSSSATFQEQKHTSFFSKPDIHFFVFYDSLTFIPFLVLYIPLILEAKLLRNPTDILLIWSLVVHLYFRFMLFVKFAMKPGKDIFAHDFQAISIRRIWCLLVGFFLVLYLLVALRYIGQDISLAGDEPEYVMVAHSLWHDGDIMVKDNYNRHEYRLFYRHPLAFGRTTWEGYPVEGLLVSLYLFPYYVLGHWLNLAIAPVMRLAMVPLAVLLIGEIFLLLCHLVPSRKIALTVSVICGLSSPLIFHAPLVFSEITGALLLSFTLRSILAMKEKSYFRLTAPLGIILFLWTGAKYIAFAFPLGLWFLVRSVLDWRGSTARSALRKKIIISFLVLITMGTMYFTFLRIYYQSFSPLATRGGELLEFTRKEGTGLADSFAWLFGNRISRLPYSVRVGLGNFMDQKIGLLMYAPFYVLFFAGLWLIMRHKLTRVWPFMAIFFLYWLLLFWLSYWEGYGPPTRYLVPIVPILAIGVSYALYYRVNSQAIFFGLAFWGIGIVLLALRKPYLLYHHTLWRFSEAYNNFLNTYSGQRFLLRSLFPSFTEFPFNWQFFSLWLVLISVLVVVAVRKNSSSFFYPVSIVCSVLFLLFVPFIISLYLTDPIPYGIEYAPESRYTSPVQIGKAGAGAYNWEESGFWGQKNRQSTLFVRSDRSDRMTIVMEVHSLVPNQITFMVARNKIIVKVPPMLKKIIHWSNIKPFRQSDLNYVQLVLTPRTGKNLFFSNEGSDGRELGIFMNLK